MNRIVMSADAARLDWVKSSFSSSSNGEDCIEVAATSGSVYVRDSKNVPGPRVAVTPGTWSAFVSYAAEG